MRRMLPQTEAVAQKNDSPPPTATALEGFSAHKFGSQDRG